MCCENRFSDVWSPRPTWRRAPLQRLRRSTGRTSTIVDVCSGRVVVDHQLGLGADPRIHALLEARLEGACSFPGDVPAGTV